MVLCNVLFGMNSGIFKAKITDWRAMVDTVLIDVDYDGQIFNVNLIASLIW